jgi:hypothetical protein
MKNDPSLYGEIASRFQAGDTTLNGIEWMVLYYGSAYTDDYKPYSEGMLDKAMFALIEEEKYTEAISMGEDVLSSHPAYTEMYLNIALTYDRLNDTINFHRYLDLYYNLLSIPAYSGSGSSMDSAYVVRSVNDEYVLLREMGYGRPHSQGLVWDDENSIPFDRMTVKDENGEDIDFYFNIYQPYILGLTKMLQPDSGKGKAGKSRKKKRKEKKKRKQRQ